MKPRSLVLGLIAACPLGAAEPPPVSDAVMRRPWKAQWIACPGAPDRDAGVYRFRKVLDLPQVPARFRVHVSADQRFVLSVNGQRVGIGPSRGDLYYWRFETFDLAPLLKPGKNLLVALVWNFGKDAPVAQVTDRTGFIAEADTEAEASVRTDKTWECAPEPGHQPWPEGVAALRAAGTYFVVGPGERLDAARYDWDWSRLPGADGGSGPMAAGGGPGRRQPAFDPRGPGLGAHPRGPMARARRAAADGVPAGVRRQRRPNREHTRHGPAVAGRAHPREDEGHDPVRPQGAGGRLPAPVLLEGSGGEGASQLPGGPRQGPLHEGQPERDRSASAWSASATSCCPTAEVAASSSRSGGGPGGSWRSRWRPADEPLVIDGLLAFATGYPFAEKGRFDAGDPTLARVWETGWRTARLCAHETYMDCPYYEQLQYVGDTRVQALISYAVAGDDRLARQAIEAYDHSRRSDGITSSRYPSSPPQYIPPFSLLWVGMVHDFWRYRDDPAFVKQQLPGTRSVLDFYLAHQREDGLVGFVPWWSFIDWTGPFASGVPPAGRERGLDIDHAPDGERAARGGRPRGRSGRFARARPPTGRPRRRRRTPW